MAETKNLHIVVFPWLAFAHTIPFLELAKSIAERGHRVSFVSKFRNIDRLPKVPTKLNSILSFIKLSLPHIDGLPENAEASTDVPVEKVQYLKKAFDGLQNELAQFLESSAVDWIIYDFAPHWLPSIAAKFGISTAFFCTVTAWSGAFYGSSISMMDGSDYRSKPEDFLVPPKWIPFPSNIALRSHEIRRHRKPVGENVSGISDLKRFAMTVIGCDAFLIRSCKELENDWLDLLAELHQKPVVPTGLLPPSQDSEVDEDDTWQVISGWLNMHNEGTVIYVALGTEVMLSQDELSELAIGLENSGLPFFWALRKQVGVEFQSFELPDGFEERVKDRGMVWTSWTPQVKILSHNSVGCFLTHCGWSSVIEGLRYGRPLLMLPFVGDQGLNARALEDRVVGIEIPRNDEDGLLCSNSVAESLTIIMTPGKAKIYREKAREIQVLFGDRNLHERYIDNLTEYLQKHRRVHEQIPRQCCGTKIV